MLCGEKEYPQSAYRKGGVFNLRLNTPVAKATSLFRKRNSEPLTALPDKASPERGGARRRRAEGFVPLRREGRGGSVSRRDHNPVYRRRAHLSGGTKPAEARNPNASRSSRVGVWGRGASLREAASPPESLTLPTSLPVCRCLGGSGLARWWGRRSDASHRRRPCDRTSCLLPR